MSAERLDQAVVRLGYAESREKAQRLIRAGAIRVNDQVRDKPGQTITAEDRIEAAAAERFVSRGGEKLEEAFRQFHLDVEGLTCADIGSSTGGFTDCLLQHGAARVFAVDVGKGQLHWKIREDVRVTVME
ncbi:MAG: TlyA family rRNA (cytidine-2'-O)-methyltransferase, partial [Kiritimatiellae bacterium]|nr:TlyA family rRNA (cytidine-2'-O)-methyltransferase [Kiritimatiellia bacterium]